MREEWRIIPDFEPYEVSDLGRVRRGETIIKPVIKRGYQYVCISLKSKKYTKTIHRLVMSAFIGKSKLDVDHINAVRWDNRLDNLRYVSARQNSRLREGVNCFCRRGNKFYSTILIEDKRYWLGTFNTPEEAQLAYEAALKKAKNKNSRGEYI